MAKKSTKQAETCAKLLVCSFYTSSIFDILIAVALLDLKLPINLIKDYRGEGPSLKEREA